jgi:hypothetical protein
VLEGRRTDAAVCSAPADFAHASGGFLTIVAVVGDPWTFDCAPLVGGCVTKDYLREHAWAWLSKARARLPISVSVRTAVDQASPLRTVVRRVDAAAHDLVIVRRRWLIGSRLRRANVAIVQVSAEATSDRRRVPWVKLRRT